MIMSPHFARLDQEGALECTSCSMRAGSRMIRRLVSESLVLRHRNVVSEGVIDRSIRGALHLYVCSRTHFEGSDPAPRSTILETSAQCLFTHAFISTP